jgi:polar amino acid transport system substrate-binding protein
MMSLKKIAAGFAVLIGLTGAVFALEDSVREIAPTGALRVAVAVGPAASTFWATRDPSSGAARGVTVELAKAAAEKLHVPLKLVEYQNSGGIAAAQRRTRGTSRSCRPTPSARSSSTRARPMWCTRAARTPPI